MERNIKSVLNNVASILEKSGSLSPKLDAEVLLAFLLGKDRSYLYMYPEKGLEAEIYHQYLLMIDEREKGKPVQYITGHQEFMNLDFLVNRHVLVPRPDTEILVEEVLQTIKTMNNPKLTIADIGCGSGAISISLSYYEPTIHVYSIDISTEALNIAQQNAKKLGVAPKIEFLHGDMLSPLKDKVDIIVSNPPYIPSNEIDFLQVEVSQYEPRTALDGGKDGLYFYRKIIDSAPNYIVNDGYLFLEIGHDQGKGICALLSEKSVYSNIEVIKDLAGLDRVVKTKLRIKNE